MLKQKCYAIAVRDKDNKEMICNHSNNSHESKLKLVEMFCVETGMDLSEFNSEEYFVVEAEIHWNKDQDAINAI